MPLRTSLFITIASLFMTMVVGLCITTYLTGCQQSPEPPQIVPKATTDLSVVPGLEGCTLYTIWHTEPGAGYTERMYITRCKGNATVTRFNCGKNCVRDIPNDGE